MKLGLLPGHGGFLPQAQLSTYSTKSRLPAPQEPFKERTLAETSGTRQILWQYNRNDGGRDSTFHSMHDHPLKSPRHWPFRPSWLLALLPTVFPSCSFSLLPLKRIRKAQFFLFCQTGNLLPLWSLAQDILRTKTAFFLREIMVNKICSLLHLITHTRAGNFLKLRQL